MTILKFKCELLSDVILNQKAASEGPNQTLDFIPGSNFLGIVAGQLYPKPTETRSDGYLYADKEGMSIARCMFHSNEVHFGDAHPACGENRTLRVPAALFFAKGQKEEERIHYVHHAITKEVNKKISESNIQLKQERYGFIDFASISRGTAIRLKVSTSFAIKSAYDPSTRRSKDAQLFGYQSMDKGMIFYFSVEIEDSKKEEYANRIKDALIGIKHIGRSRCAQYGLVEISEYDYKEVESGVIGDAKEIVIYADSRLIFLDDNGIPTYQPSVEQLLGKKYENMEIDWSESQIRTFKYAPYNNVRKCFDTDRCGIEKGSVIVVKIKDGKDVRNINLPFHVGSYQNEGFGKVIFNPPFLCANKDGLLGYEIVSAENQSVDNQLADRMIEKPISLLVAYIDAQKQRDTHIADVYQKANEWVNAHASVFRCKVAYASQWGTIRSIAMKCGDKDELVKQLFEYDKERKTGGYLVHGVAAEKWQSYIIEDLKNFVTANTSEHIINLASMMQNKCREKEEQEEKK